MSTPHQTRSKFVVAAILVGALLTVSNPTGTQHENAIHAKFASLHPLYEPLGVPVRAMYHPTYSSFGVGSLTTHNDSVTSFGVLGYVWVFPTAFLSSPGSSPPDLTVSADAATSAH